MSNYYRIGEFAKLIGKSPQTLRNWDRMGTLKPAMVDDDGRKLYSKEQLDMFLNETERMIIGYCRVNGYNQSDELSKQVQVLKDYMDDKHYDYQIISEIGSGLKYNRKGLIDLIKLISENKVGKIVALKRDSLVRYGFEMIETLCKMYGCDIECIDESFSYDDYCSDIATIIKHFNYEMEGKRAAKAKRKIQELVQG